MKYLFRISVFLLATTIIASQQETLVSVLRSIGLKDVLQGETSLVKVVPDHDDKHPPKINKSSL
jgi:hypothetical protein